MEGSLLTFLESFLTPKRLARLEDALSLRTRHVAVVLENLYRTQNASACLRTCEAFGVQDVYVVASETGFRVNRDIAQGAAGWLTLETHEGQDQNPCEECFQSLREKDYKIVAVSGRQASGELRDYDPCAKSALVFGNEKEGLSEQALKFADEVCSLPMFGFTESFNLSVAVALSLRELLPRVRQDDIPWQLSLEETQELREEWVRHSLGYRLETIERDYHRRAQKTG